MSELFQSHKLLCHTASLQQSSDCICGFSGLSILRFCGMGKKSRKPRKEASIAELEQEFRGLEQMVGIVVGETLSAVPVDMNSVMTPDGLRDVYQQGLNTFNEKKGMNLAMGDFFLRPDPVDISQHPRTWEDYDKNNGFVTMVLRDQPMNLSQESINAIDSQRHALGMSLVKPLKKKTGTTGLLTLSQEIDELKQMMTGLLSDNRAQKLFNERLLSDIQLINERFLEQKLLNEWLVTQVEYLMKEHVDLNSILLRKMIYEARKAGSAALSTLSPRAQELLRVGTAEGNLVSSDLYPWEVGRIAAAVTAMKEDRTAWEDIFSFLFKTGTDSYLGF